MRMSKQARDKQLQDGHEGGSDEEIFNPLQDTSCMGDDEYDEYHQKRLRFTASLLRMEAGKLKKNERSQKKRKETSSDLADELKEEKNRVSQGKRRSWTRKSPIPPSKHFQEFNDSLYGRYDHKKPNNPHTRIIKFRKFSQSNHFKLFVKGESIRWDKVPTIGLRLDDLTVARLLGSERTQRYLNQNYIAEFDTKGMIRAERFPLGRAFKIEAQTGDKDIDGNEIEAGEAGFYYGWWRGLHMLPGKEGAHLYMTRPSGEDPRCDGFAFKKAYRAIVQMPNGAEPFEGDNDHLDRAEQISGRVN